jgi:hypothetical protein
VEKIADQAEAFEAENRHLKVRGKRHGQAMAEMQQQQDAMECAIGDLEQDINGIHNKAQVTICDMKRQQDRAQEHSEHQVETLWIENQILRRRSQQPRQDMEDMSLEWSEMQEIICQLARQLGSASQEAGTTKAVQLGSSSAVPQPPHQSPAGMRTSDRGVLNSDRSGHSVQDEVHGDRSPTPEESLVYLGSRSTLTRGPPPTSRRYQS